MKTNRFTVAVLAAGLFAPATALLAHSQSYRYSSGYAYQQNSQGYGPSQGYGYGQQAYAGGNNFQGPPPPPGGYGQGYGQGPGYGPGGWDAPPSEFTRDIQRNAFRDGINGARRDLENRRPPNVMNRDEYRNYRGPERRAYRQAFERGYNAFWNHMGPGPRPY